MKIQFIDNTNGGFSDEIEVRDGLTVKQLFDVKIGGNVGNYLIRVNRETVDLNRTLVNGDRVSVTMKKVEGAVVAS